MNTAWYKQPASLRMKRRVSALRFLETITSGWRVISARIRCCSIAESIFVPVTQTNDSITGLGRAVARRVLRSAARQWLWKQQHSLRFSPPIGWVRFGSLRRLTPVSRVFGFDRGQCIDRYYIENFLSQSSEDIRGHVLEVADNDYTIKFGGSRVTKSDILYARDGNPKATIIADLSGSNSIPSSTFDCVILTQTLQFIYEVRAAIETLFRILKPSGVLLATVPAITKITRSDMNRWGNFWRFAPVSLKSLFKDRFPAGSIQVQSHGN